MKFIIRSLEKSDSSNLKLMVNSPEVISSVNSAYVKQRETCRGMNERPECFCKIKSIGEKTPRCSKYENKKSKSFCWRHKPEDFHTGLSISNSDDSVWNMFICVSI